MRQIVRCIGIIQFIVFLVFCSTGYAHRLHDYDKFAPLTIGVFSSTVTVLCFAISGALETSALKTGSVAKARYSHQRRFRHVDLSSVSRGQAMKYRKKPVVIEASRWWKNGDHPEDDSKLVTKPDGSLAVDGSGKAFKREGKVVRYFRHPQIPGERICFHCQHNMNAHGWIDTLEGGHTVCPGDWIITGVKGERYPCKPDIFEVTYEPVEKG